MAIVEMQKIHIVSLPEHKDAILKALQKNEILHLESISQDKSPGEKNRYEYDLAEIKSTIAFLESASKVKKSFIDSLVPPKEEISEEELLNIFREFNCQEINRKRKNLENHLNNLINLRNDLCAKQEKLTPWKSLDFPLKDLFSTSKTRFLMGKIKSKQYREFKDNIERISKATQIEEINQTREETYLALVYLISAGSALSEFSAKSEFSEVSLPLSEKTPAQEMLHIQSLLEETKQEIKEAKIEAQKMAQDLSKLKSVYDFILANKTHLETKQKLIDTTYTFIIEGWIRKTDLAKLKSLLSKTTKQFEIYKIKPNQEEKAPVFLKNPKFLTPFELITKIYGTPKTDEIDPSLPLSLFFALFFGLCLGDFGYGIILSLFSIYFLKNYKLSEGGKNLLKLLLLGGGVAAMVGILTGSYLGLSPKEIPTALMPLKQFLLSLQIVDPMKSPLVMLVFSLTLGVIQILYGIFLQMAHKLKKHEIAAAVLDDGVWLFFLGALVMLIVSSALGLEIAALASKLSLGGAVALVLTQGRHKKNIVQKFLSGLLSLYKLSGYMGDTLSYSRLLALGMSTAIIGSVINILAGMVLGSVPVAGIFLMLLLLVVGHVFNLVVSTLGAFVHSTRLQMVEFFSKFFEGGGREFKPYRRVAEYTVLKGGC